MLMHYNLETGATNDVFAQDSEDTLERSDVSELSVNATGFDESLFEERVNYHQIFFGCDLQPPQSCDRIANEFKAFSTIAASSKVIPRLLEGEKYSEGKYGQALDLVARYRESVEIANNPSLHTDRFSVSFWIKPPREPELYSHIISHVDSSQSRGWFIEHISVSRSTNQSSPSDANESFIVFVMTAGEGDLVFSQEIPIRNDEQFHHVAATFDGSQMKVYLGGEEVGSTTYDEEYLPGPEVPLKIGSAAYSVSTNRWTGTIDDLILFNTVLDKEDVEDIANSDVSFSDILEQYPGTIAYYPFDGNLSSGMGNNTQEYSTVLASMVFAPDGRMFFTEMNTGRIMIMENDQILEEPFAQISDLYVSWEQGLLGITLDSKFAENHYVYVYYTAVDEETDEVHNRVVRFTDNYGRAENMVVLLDKIPAVKGYHSGGALAFNPIDETLYVTVGDATEHIFAQDPNTYLGKVLRINRDGTFPQDNPFDNSPVYTVGSRNMYGLAFDEKGYGIMTENGDGAFDEINHIRKGANYGFPTIQRPNLPPELTDPSDADWPLRSYRPTYAPTQAIYYTGDKFPELKGKFIFGTYTGDLFVLSIDKERNQILEEIRMDVRPSLFTPIIGIAQSPGGDIYFGSYGISKLESSGYESRRQVLFPISLSTPSNVEVNSINVDTTTNSLLINTVGGSGEYDIGVRMPKIVLDDIYRVNNGDGVELDYEVISGLDGTGTEYNDIVIRYVGSDNQDSSIQISGANVIPELGTSVFFVLSAALLTTSIVFFIFGKKYLGWKAEFRPE